MLTQTCFKTPERSCSVAIPNTRKNEIRIMIVSCRSGNEEITAETNVFNPLIAVTAFRGLKTLKALSELRLKPP